MSPFERFFVEDFRDLTDRVLIPAATWATPPAAPGNESWDRKAAWLLYCQIHSIPVELRPLPKKAWEEDGY